MIELNKDQINAIVSIVADDLSKSYKERKLQKLKEVEEDPKIKELFESIRSIKAERDRLQKELNKLTRSGEKILSDNGLSPWMLNYDFENFKRSYVEQCLIKLVKMPTKAEIKNELIIQTIQSIDVESLLANLKSKFE